MAETIATRSSRAASVQPGSSVGVAKSKPGRLGSEPLHSDARSFIEESEVYRGANVATPQSQRSAAPQRFQRQMTTRSSARLAARNSLARESSPEATPSKGRGESPSKQAMLSDSIDEDDDEDPLHTPRIRGFPKVGGASLQPPSTGQQSNLREYSHFEDLERISESPSPSPLRSQKRPTHSGQHPNLLERVHLANLARSDLDSSSEDEESDEGTGQPPRQVRTEGGSNRPNPVQEAKSGGLLFPRPDRPAGTQASPGRPNGQLMLDLLRRKPNQPQPQRPNDQPMFENPQSQPSPPQPQRPNDKLMFENPQSQPSPPRSRNSNDRTMFENPQSQPSQSRPQHPNVKPMFENLQSQPSPPRPQRPNSQPKHDHLQSQPDQPGQPRPQLANNQPRPHRPVSQAHAGPQAQTGAEGTGESAHSTGVLYKDTLNGISIGRGSGRADNRPADERNQQLQPANPVDAEPQEEDYEEHIYEEHRPHLTSDAPSQTKDGDLFNKIFQWSCMFLKIWAILVAACILWLILLDSVIPIKTWEGIDVGRDYEYFGAASWRQRILQIIPWVVLHPFSVLTGNLDYADYRKVLNGLDLNTQTHEMRINTLSAATWQMRRVLPDLIKVNVRSDTGEWTVDDDFWNALDAEMHEGGIMYSLLTLKKSEDGFDTISDAHWNAIKQRIDRDHTLISDRPGSEEAPLDLSDQVMAYVNQHISKVWGDWLKANEDAVGKLQGKPVETPSRVYKELYGDLERAMNERLKTLGLEQGIVTKEEFIRKLEGSIEKHREKVEVEMKNLDSKLGQAIGIAIEAKNAVEASHDVGHEEIRETIDKAIRQAIADAQLEAIAKGHIKSHLDTELVRQKNYFNTLRGAVIDHTLTSSTYTWEPRGEERDQDSESRGWSLFPIWKKQQQQTTFREGGESLGRPFSAAIALKKWEGDGECWCAGLADAKNITSVADLAVFTAETVVPQYLVVEHIDPGASFDPKSMPKDIEFWIRTPNDKRARTLDHWSKERWPEIKYDAASKSLLNRGFVKAGQFQYDNGIGKGESQVFKFPDELLNMDAQTQQVVVRATTNYGAEDHTCFYRLRLFGDKGIAGKFGVL